METRHGQLAASWRITDGDFFAKVTVPPNTTAEVTLPVTGQILEGGVSAQGRPGIREIKANQLTLGSGTYQFSARY